jgi:hypothetical protein
LKAAIGKKTSPRTSIKVGVDSPFNWCGKFLMVLTLSVTSSLQVSNSFNILTRPLIAVESNTNKTLDDELLIFNSQEILYKKYIFIIRVKIV